MQADRANKERMLAECWAARFASRRPLRWLLRRRAGRIVLYWLTTLAGMAAIAAVALALLPLDRLAESLTGSEWAGLIAGLLAASLVVSAWMYAPLSTTVSRRLAAWLQQLEEKPR
jgi:hypothetical protein